MQAKRIARRVLAVPRFLALATLPEWWQLIRTVTRCVRNAWDAR